MMNSNVMRYALLAVSVNKQNHLFQSNYLAGLVALGLYELEECGSLTWDGERCVLGQPVPEERAYLAGLYQSIAGAADQSMRGLLVMMLKQGAQAFSDQVNQWMVDQGWVTATTKKGLFGVESQRLGAAVGGANAGERGDHHDAVVGELAGLPAHAGVQRHAEHIAALVPARVLLAGFVETLQIGGTVSVGCGHACDECVEGVVIVI